MAEQAQTYVVTGANRGLGLELARQLAARGHHVIGTARSAAAAPELAALGARVEELDVADGASVARFAARLAGVPVDVLVNNAGRQYREGKLERLDLAELEDTFAVNAFGPVRVTRALLANLRAGRGRRVVHVSSRMGSFGEFAGGGMMAYRASKAALNMFHRCLGDDLGAEGFLCVALHPGWVRTDMGGPEAAVGVEESAAGMLRVLDGLAPDDHGAFLDYTGAVVAW